MLPCPLLRRIDLAIQSNPHATRHRVYLENRSNRIVLRGTVDTFYQKQMIQESLRSIDGIECIHNQLEVVEMVNLFRRDDH